MFRYVVAVIVILFLMSVLQLLGINIIVNTIISNVFGIIIFEALGDSNKNDTGDNHDNC
jgi:hypothetical protein